MKKANLNSIIGSLVSGSKVIKALLSSCELSNYKKSDSVDFADYLTALSVIATFEGKTDNTDVLVKVLSESKENEVISWLDSKTGNKGGITGKTVITRIKTVVNRKLS